MLEYEVVSIAAPCAFLKFRKHNPPHTLEDRDNFWNLQNGGKAHIPRVMMENVFLQK